MVNKRAAEMVLAIFVAAIFLSSYASLAGTNSNTQSSTTTVVAVPQTFYGVGYANATFEGYNNTLTMVYLCNDSSIYSGSASNLLTGLEINNSIFSYFSSGNNVTVQTNSMDLTSLRSYLVDNMNVSENCLTFYYRADILLPSTVTMSISGKQYNIPITQSMNHYSLMVPYNSSTNKNIRVKIAALVEQNGTIYNLNVTRSGA
ncbi:MAG: hypothetical protein M1122_02350 [Candidatus Marsarchaeota archaeon]|jgi:hypothetical protein|nr:hypothetical protein [Candidatus Marsarchaeota archaeon]